LSKVKEIEGSRGGVAKLKPHKKILKIDTEIGQKARFPLRGEDDTSYRTYIPHRDHSG
jgi:hypothetical protein